MTSRPQSLEAPGIGIGLVALVVLPLVAWCAALYWGGEGTLDAVRSIDRLTIRAAVLLFSLAYVAPAIRSLFAGRSSDWLLVNQRALVIAFVVAFAMHLMAIARLYALDAALFWSASPVPLIVLRSIAIAFIILMLLAALGARRVACWTRLMGFGAFYVWGAFMVGFAKRIAQDHVYILPVMLLVAVMAVKLIDTGRRAYQRADKTRSWL